MNILLIEDSLADLTLFKEIVRPLLMPDDELLAAESGEKGLEICTRRSVDLLITDLLLPGMSGIDVLVQVKKVSSRTEVIVVTCSPSVEMAVVAMKKGARDYISKPINAGLLAEKINHFREFIANIRDAENYRFAKERMEESAMNTIRHLELLCSANENFFEQVNSILGGSSPDADKIRAVRNVMNRFKSGKEILAADG